MVLELGPWGRLLSIAVAACVVLLVLVVVVCFVGPGCWGYEWLNAEENERRRRRQAAAATMQTTAMAVSQSSGEILNLAQLRRPNSSFDTGSGSFLLGRMDTHRDSTYSSMSEATDRSASFRSVSTADSADTMSLDERPTSISGPSGPRASTPAPAPTTMPLEEPSRQEPPQLDLGLQFVANGDNNSGHLHITVKGASRLPGRIYVGGLEPFVALTVVRCTWPLHRRAGPPLHSLRTQALRHSFSPRFQQAFDIDARRNELKEWNLRATAFDQDRYGNPTELSFVDISLRDLKGLSAGQQVDLSLPMQISNKENGELLLGLSYLPTAQRLTVSIIRCARLKYLEVAESLAEFSPFVRVIQLHSTTGRSLKRKKTSVRSGSDAPEFGETLIFNIGVSQLESAVFLVLLMNRVKRRDDGDTRLSRESLEFSDASRSTSSSSSRSSSSCDRCLGKTAVGRLVGSRRGRQHWFSVLQTPRTVHSAWHTLK